jgi:hypothetical protein
MVAVPEIGLIECRICQISRVSFWIAVGVTATCGALALLAPEDVLSASPTLATLYALMNGVFPVIGHYTGRSAFPEITGLYMSLMFSAFPFALVGILCTFNSDRRLLASVYESERPVDVSFHRYLSGAVAIAIIAPLLAYFAWVVNPGLDIWFIDFSRSKEDLAVFGFCITLIVPTLIGVAIHLYVRLALGAKRLLIDYIGIFGHTKDED